MTLDHATGARVSQADVKGWTNYAKEMRESIRKLVLPMSEIKKPSRSNKAMGAFFKTLAQAKGRNQA